MNISGSFIGSGVLPGLVLGKKLALKLFAIHSIDRALQKACIALISSFGLAVLAHTQLRHHLDNKNCAVISLVPIAVVNQSPLSGICQHLKKQRSSESCSPGGA